MYVVYVLSKDGRPLMPTTRFGHVRRLLKSGKAKAVSTKPFVIRLQYESESITQPLYGGTDPGRTNIGEAVINTKGQVVYAANVLSRNKEVPKLMTERAAHRNASRRGERLRRKRRAKKNGTTTTFPEGRRLPGYEDGVLSLKGIINTEAKFLNRRCRKGWITPTVRQCVQTHISVIRRIRKILPVTDWTLEYNKFAFMELEDGRIYGADFQNGRLKGYDSVESYVSALQDGRCAICGGKIELYHHIVPRHEGGSNLPENLVGLCHSCHREVHTNKKLLARIGKKKKYAGASVLNAAIPRIYQAVLAEFGESHVHICSGKDTYDYRKKHPVVKDHFADACCIAAIGEKVLLADIPSSPFVIQQFRCHNRQIIHAQRERTYRLNGKIIAKNRKPRFEQGKKIPALSDWYAALCKEIGVKEARKKLSAVSVSKSVRYRNNLKRVLPGAIFLYKGARYVLSGMHSNGVYLRACGYGKKEFPAKQCHIVARESLVYV